MRLLYSTNSNRFVCQRLPADSCCFVITPTPLFFSLYFPSCLLSSIFYDFYHYRMDDTRPLLLLLLFLIPPFCRCQPLVFFLSTPCWTSTSCCILSLLVHYFLFWKKAMLNYSPSSFVSFAFTSTFLDVPCCPRVNFTLFSYNPLLISYQLRSDILPIFCCHPCWTLIDLLLSSCPAPYWNFAKLSSCLLLDVLLPKSYQHLVSPSFFFDRKPITRLPLSAPLLLTWYSLATPIPTPWRTSNDSRTAWWFYSLIRLNFFNMHIFIVRYV